MVQVLLLLAREEDEATAIGNHIPTHKVSPVTFLKQGLNLKEQQQVTSVQLISFTDVHIVKL